MPETRRSIDPDRELVAEARAGRTEAFDELVRRHQARVFSLARALSGRDGDAEDLAQEVFIRAWRAIGRFRGDSAFGTWLYRIAVNVINSHLAAQSRRRFAWGWWSREKAETPAPERVAAREDLESDIVRRDAIDRALATLSPDSRMAVVLRDVEGLEYREIANALGVPIGTVMSRIARGRARLRPLLASLAGRATAGAGREG